MDSIDPSELLRPELKFADKNISKFRDYSVDETDPLKERVRNTYRMMHLNQTMDFVKSKLIKKKQVLIVKVINFFLKKIIELFRKLTRHANYR